jgi:hypothetical protein
MIDKTDINVIFRNLSRKSQLHLLELANTALIAEQAVKKELKKERETKTA